MVIRFIYSAEIGASPTARVFYALASALRKSSTQIARFTMPVFAILVADDDLRASATNWMYLTINEGLESARAESRRGSRRCPSSSRPAAFFSSCFDAVVAQLNLASNNVISISPIAEQ